MCVTIDVMAKKKRDATFGGRLRIAREDAELSQEQLTEILAERYGEKVGRSYISELERNWGDNKMPMANVAAALARALNVNGNWLLLLDDRQEPPGSEPTRSMSAEGDELANIADVLPAWRRRELLEVARVMQRGGGDDLRVDVRRMTDELQAQLAAARIIIGDAALSAIEAAVMRILTGGAATPAPINQADTAHASARRADSVS
jgi:transcriptional regulator with XRE-family HTH domain